MPKVCINPLPGRVVCTFRGGSTLRITLEYYFKIIAIGRLLESLSENRSNQVDFDPGNPEPGRSKFSPKSK